MKASHLSPDDLPPSKPDLGDRLLRYQLDMTLTEQFWQHCDSKSQSLLEKCDWIITTIANVATLVIICPNREWSWKILNRVLNLGNQMAQISQDAKLRIYTTPEKADWFDIRVEELSVYNEKS
jgi:hypothetical protein